MTGFVVMLDSMWVHVGAALDKEKLKAAITPHKIGQCVTSQLLQRSAVCWYDCYFAEQSNVINNAVLTSTTINKF